MGYPHSRPAHQGSRGAECAARELGALLVKTQARCVSCSPAAGYLQSRSVRESAPERRQSESKGEDMADIKGKGFEAPDEVRPFKDGKG